MQARREEEIRRLASSPERIREILAEAEERVLGRKSANSPCQTPS